MTAQTASRSKDSAQTKTRTRVPSRLDQLLYKATETLLYPVEDWRRRVTGGQQQTIVNQKDIRVVGMRRTGNHALLSWIEKQQTGSTFHLNNVAAGTHPYRYKSDNLRRYHPEYLKMAEVYRRQSKGDFVPRDCLLFSYEDWSLAQITRPAFERNRTLYLGKSAQSFDVLILRDPFNLFASRLKQDYTATKSKKLSMVEMWLEYAKEFVGESQYLSQNSIFINYNRWFSDKAYRRDLADQLGLTFSDAGLTSVPTFGGGSSFDGTALSGQARQMDVTNRWQTFENDEAFRELFQNSDVWHYSQRIFGELLGTERLRSQ